jgi:cytochrome c
MKKIILLCSLFAFMIACNNADTGKAEPVVAEPVVVDITQDPVYQAALTIEAKSDCITCHKLDEKLIGPSYKEIAEKYGANAEEMIPKLAQKILEGGQGVWGEIPMTPHTALTKEEAETLVKYIFLLNK